MTEFVIQFTENFHFGQGFVNITFEYSMFIMTMSILDLTMSSLVLFMSFMFRIKLLLLSIISY